MARKTSLSSLEYQDIMVKSQSRISWVQTQATGLLYTLNHPNILSVIRKLGTEFKEVGDGILLRLFSFSWIKLSRSDFGVLKSAKEILKIVVVITLLFAVIYFIFPVPSQAVQACIQVPTVEEIIYRGLILEGFHRIQQLINAFFTEGVLSLKDVEKQKSFRIRVVAGFYGMSHLFNRQSLIFGVFQAAYTTYLGVVCGQLKERTHSMALPILAHALNNVLVRAVHCGVVPACLGLTALAVYQVGLFCLTDVDNFS